MELPDCFHFLIIHAPTRLAYHVPAKCTSLCKLELLFRKCDTVYTRLVQNSTRPPSRHVYSTAGRGATNRLPLCSYSLYFEMRHDIHSLIELIARCHETLGIARVSILSPGSYECGQMASLFCQRRLPVAVSSIQSREILCGVNIGLRVANGARRVNGAFHLLVPFHEVYC